MTVVPRKTSTPALFVSTEPVVNALMRGLTQVVFSLQRGSESAVGEHGVEAGIKVDVTFPCP